MGTKIQVSGYSAKITQIDGQVGGTSFWHREDTINVWVEFTPYVGSVISTCFELPAKKYTRDSFLHTLELEIEKWIKDSLKKQEEEQRERVEKQRRQNNLDGLVVSIRKEISLG